MRGHYRREQLIWESNLKSGEKILLLALNSFVDGNGRCWPKQRTLGSMTGQTRRTIMSTCQSLEEKKILAKETRFKDKQKISSLYTVNFDRIEALTRCEKNSHTTQPDVKKDHGGCEKRSRGDVKKDHGGCETVSHQYLSNDLSNYEPLTEPPRDASLEETHVEQERTREEQAEDSSQPTLPLSIQNVETWQEEERQEDKAKEGRQKKAASLEGKAGNGPQAGDWDGTQSSGGGAAASQSKTRLSHAGTKHNAAASFEQQFKLRSQGDYEFWRTGTGQNDWHEPAVQGILSWLKKKWPEKGWDRGDAIAYIAKREHPDKDEYPVLVARMQEIQNQLSASAKLSTPAVARDDSHRHRGPKVAPSKIRSYIEKYHATVAAKKTEEA